MSCPCHATGVLRRRLPQERAAHRKRSLRARLGMSQRIPGSSVQRPSRSCPFVVGGGFADGVRPRCARPRGARGEGREPHPRATRSRVGRSVSRAAAEDAPRGSERARLRPQQLPEARRPGAGNGSVLVGPVVRRVEESVDPDPSVRVAAGPYLACDGRVAVARIDRRRRSAAPQSSASWLAFRHGAPRAPTARDLFTSNSVDVSGEARVSRS
jgi:hypothetical protein